MIKYKVGSLYAGVGGICLGFLNADFDVVWANEYDKYACETYKKNFRHTLIEKDVFNVDINKLEKIDVLTAGFPCQPFSVAGYKKGFQDPRGNHFFRVLDFVDILRPKVIFLENVKNLVGHDKGKTFKIIRNSILDRGYSFDSKVLNTKDYNIPQNRERIFIVCFDLSTTKNANILFSFPQKTKLKTKITDIIYKSKVEDRYYYGEEKSFYEILVKDIKSRETIYQWRRHYVRENKNNVCPTLTANMGTGGHNVPLILTDYGIRKLTPKECFAFQGFPILIDRYELPPLSDCHLYKQAGNSVSVPVIESIAQNIMKALKGVNCNRVQQLKLDIPLD